MKLVESSFQHFLDTLFILKIKYLMLSNRCAGEDSWKSPGLQEDQTSES